MEALLNLKVVADSLENPQPILRANIIKSVVRNSKCESGQLKHCELSAPKIKNSFKYFTDTIFKFLQISNLKNEETNMTIKDD
jgi:hypothetical protein